MKTIKINENDSGQRLDAFMRKLFKNVMPQSLIYKSIRKKRVKVNGKKSEINYILQLGDVLDLYINDEFFVKEKTVKPKDFTPNLKIIYEDKNIALIDKSPGILTHSNGDKATDTIASQFLSYLVLKGEYQPDKENSFTPALCNRLDRNTGGIVIAAKNAAALRTMNEIIRQRMVKKIYLALCEGKFKNKRAVLKGYLVKNKHQNKAYISETAQNGAVEIVTAYNVIRQGKSNALVEVELITGRTHQIRAHLAAIGHPIVGDMKYGNGKPGQHQALCAHKLIFLNGFEGSTLSYLIGKAFSSEYPDFLRHLPL
ncbi:MAG: RluA family pseudouridine synthase [Firmicutes bacterium]|nr:RluA family pseudouridine synthase [Bacillota bacterium]